MNRFIVIALFACSLQFFGQAYIPDMSLSSDFAAQVKSVDEFIARFNGDEFKPELRTDSIRRDNILSLCDFKMSHSGMDDTSFKKLLLGFTREAVNWNGRLDIASQNTVAEVVCSFKFVGKLREITLLMQRETTSKGNQRWAICGVKGLEKIGLFDDKLLTISPVDHETHFMSLTDFFQSNKKLVPSMRSKQKEIDQMSFFFGLCAANKIEFQQVDNLKFHFLDLPNYIFIIEEIGRRGTNSGWLITKFQEANMGQKIEYINNLFKGHKK